MVDVKITFDIIKGQANSVERKVMHVSFEVRLELRDALGRYAMLIRRNELIKRGNRVAIPIGGGIKAADEDSEDLGFVSPGSDLRFEIHPDHWSDVAAYFVKFTEGRLYQEAWREFYEETCEERPLLTPMECASCEFVRLRKPCFIEGSVRHDTFGESTLFLIGVVTVVPSAAALTGLLEAPNTHVEFIEPELLQKGGTTELNTLVHRLYRYLI